MHNTRTKRQQIAIRSFTYGMMTLAAIVGVVVCLMLAMGYRFNFTDGKLTQVALIQFKSFPSSATVDVNGKTLSSRTSTRYNAQSGENLINITKDGYRGWSKTVNLEPSEVLWLDYIRLIPNNIETNSVKTFSSAQEMLGSPDRKRILIRTSDSDRQVTNCPSGVTCDRSYEGYFDAPYILQLADVSDPGNVKFSDISINSDQITIPTAADSEKFSIVEWDDNSRYILLEHKVNDTAEYLVIDSQTLSAEKNLNKDFGMSITAPHFSGTSGGVFFAKTETDLRKFDYSGKTVSAPLVSNLVSYRMYDNEKLSFVTSRTANDKTTTEVGIYDSGTVEVLKTFDDAARILAGVSSYNGTDYLTIISDQTATIYSLPLDQREPKTYGFSVSVANWLDFSPDGRYVLTGGDGQLASYDLDTNKQYSFDVEGLSSAPQWLDDSHIVDNSDGIKFVEFDGSNRQSIVNGSGYVMLSSNEKYVFSLGEVSGGVALQRSKLVID